MAIRLNYTGRRKINREDIDLRLRPGTETTFDAGLKLDRYNISEADAHVWIEAYHRTTLMRFDFGRVGLIVPQTDRRLSLFPDPNAVLFRVKVTSESGANRGRLLAEADGIKGRRPDEKDDDRIPLLPIRQGILGAELWRVEYTGEGGSPELVINTATDDWKSLARDPKFHPVVAPAAMHLILTRLALVDRARNKEDDGHWHNKWWRFVVSLPGADRDFAIDDGTDAEEISGWIDDAVSAFAKESNTLETFLRATGAPPKEVRR